MSTYVLHGSDSHDLSRGIVYLARAGYAARGAVYVMVGGLALLSAMGAGGSTEDSKGALTHLMDSPGGWMLLLAIGLGLIGHAVWRLLQSGLDTDHHGRDLKALTIRAGLMISALVHTFLGVWAIEAALGYADGSSGNSGEQHWTAWLLAKPLGRWLVGAAGLGVIGAGVGQFIKGWGEKFRQRLRMSDELVRKLTPVCRFGLMARGVSLGIIGAFVLYAAIRYDPQKAGGLKSVFDTIRGVAFGQILLAILALGMLGFAVYSFIEARYRRVEAHA